MRILEQCGYIHYEDNPDGKARLMFNLNRSDLYLLDNLSENEDQVVTSLLRVYGGLFTDFVYIDESLIAQQAELSIQQVYFALKCLATKHIITFVPRRKSRISPIPRIELMEIRSSSPKKHTKTEKNNS